jgi:hypothetical protein
MHQQEEEDKILEEFQISKAVVLTGAIEYIKKIECGRNATHEQLGHWRNERLCSERRKNSHF